MVQHIIIVLIFTGIQTIIRFWPDYNAVIIYIYFFILTWQITFYGFISFILLKL